MKRERVPAGTKWDTVVGYSRAIRVGRHIHVSGTTGIDGSGEPVAPDPEAQTRQALANIEAALGQLGATMADVVRTRMFVTDIDAWEAVGRAHGEVFGELKPATSMVEVSRLIAPDLVVEIEADAVVSES
jgi:enamine deaminase RidA (YjgF/YER057c/UK114 family)